MSINADLKQLRSVSPLRQRMQEFSLIFRDHVLALSLLLSVLFLIAFYHLSVNKTAINGFFTVEGQFSLEHFKTFF